MEKYASSPQEGNYVLIEYDSKQKKYIGNITIQNELKDKYIIAKVYENSSLKLRANPSICIIPPLQNFIIQVSTNNHLIEENPSIKFQIICVPTENNIIEHQELKKVYNSIDYKKLGQKINIEGKYNAVSEELSSFNEKTFSDLSNVESEIDNDFESLKKKNEDIIEKIDDIKKKIQESKEKLKELYSKSVGLNEENKEKKENKKNNGSTFYKLLKNKYSEIFTLIAVLFSFILGAAINRLK